MSARIPFVDYLVLDEPPYLRAHQCTHCSARFFDRRNACAACGSDAGFDTVTVDRAGVVRAFTIVAFAAPGVEVPFVAATVDCAGTTVRANLVNVKPTPDDVQLGMHVRLTTYSAGTDANGTEAIGFGFEPVENGAA